LISTTLKALDHDRSRSLKVNEKIKKEIQYKVHMHSAYACNGTGASVGRIADMNISQRHDSHRRAVSFWSFCWLHTQHGSVNFIGDLQMRWYYIAVTINAFHLIDSNALRFTAQCWATCCGYSICLVVGPYVI